MQPQYLYKAHIQRVIDGDTIDATVDLGFSVKIDVRFRLAGIDTPELKSPDVIVREAAVRAKALTEAELYNKNVTLKAIKTDKYGRWLAEVFLSDGSTINQKLVEANLAVPYDGGHRE